MLRPGKKRAALALPCALLALLATLLLAPGPSAPRPAPAATPGPAYLFVSPNTDEGLSQEEAVRRLSSPRQACFRKVVADLVRQAGAAEAHIHDAIGDWSEGAENSLLAVLPAAPDLSTLGYAAAWFGLLADQKGVLFFRPQTGGRDLLATLHVSQPDLARVRRALNEHGVRDRTIVPVAGGHRVVVFDEGGKLRDHLERLGRSWGVAVQMSAGTGAFLGEEDRTRARAKFRQVIDAYEARGARPRYRPREADTCSPAQGLVCAGA